jgi:hypothetical protein
MGRHKKRRRRKDKPTVSGPFAGLYWHQRQLARRHGLFILFDGNPKAPRLTFFEMNAGLALLNY